MALIGSPSVKFSVSSASGSTLMVPLTQYVDTINGVKINAMTQETHTFGDSWVENTFTGVKSVDDVTIAGFYDDIASGPHFYMGQTSDVGAERQFEIDYGSSDIQHGSYVLLSYNRKPTRGELTRYESVLKISGAITTTT